MQRMFIFKRKKSHFMEKEMFIERYGKEIYND